MFARLFGKKPAPTPVSEHVPTPAPTPVVPGISVSGRAVYSNGVHKDKGTSISVIEARYVYERKYSYQVSMSNEDKFKSGTLTDYSLNTGDGDPRDHTYSYTVTLDDGSVLTFGDLDSPRKYYFRIDTAQTGGRKLNKGRKSRKSRKARKTCKTRKTRK